MILKTFANSFKIARVDSGMEYYDGEHGVESVTCYNIWQTLSAVYYRSASLGWYMHLGSSGQSPTYNSGNIVSPITELTNISITQNVNNVDIMRSVVLIVRNDTNHTITVREVGIGGNYTSSTAAIFARTVLDSPLEIQPGETYAFTYGINVHSE